ncbi:type II toxin-antitoxin system PemK/MazF family toxin [Paenibacillus sp. HB172176]|uniref:type II toxin-antitoxin system PemK/MazF family toxin n=1 Tax=Paenibacillus sp. HB172176 TaxID=2493690 RepID=UPI00143AFE62|nr:type II toxin-antitoxin system PemK/MazF family toxin [Paenibacillus sp. HB172176]
MTGYKQGDVLLGNEMVVDIDVLIAPVTSSGGRTSFDVEIQYWEEAGLAKPSIARTSKLHTIPTASIIRPLGRLRETDLHAVLAKCKELF